jgi:hypothetical protein
MKTRSLVAAANIGCMCVLVMSLAVQAAERTAGRLSNAQ